MRLPNHQITDRKLMDLVPVVNVVLLILFFFLLSTSFVLQPGIEVRLPSSNLAAGTRQGRHVVTLKANSQNDILMFFDDRSVTDEGLRKALKEFAVKEPEEWITLNADEAVPHGWVQQISSLVMEHGFHVAIATKRTVP